MLKYFKEMLSFYSLHFVYWGCCWCGDTHYANVIFVVDIILGVMVHNRVAQWFQQREGTVSTGFLLELPLSHYILDPTQAGMDS